jgi:hypothetical protein
MGTGTKIAKAAKSTAIAIMFSKSKKSPSSNKALDPRFANFLFPRYPDNKKVVSDGIGTNKNIQCGT